MEQIRSKQNRLLRWRNRMEIGRTLGQSLKAGVVRALLAAKRDHWVQTSRAPGRQKGGEERKRADDEDGNRVQERIGRGHAKQPST